MRFLKTISVILDILILVPGVCSGQWGVTFTNPSPCVMRGSSVDLGCSYDYPVGQTVTDIYWYSSSGNTPVLLSEQPSYQGRIEYIGNKHHDCTLRINNIQDSDKGGYYFRFRTTMDYTSRTLSLSVTGLTALVSPPIASEGRQVILYCQMSCKPRPNPLWFKNGQRVPKPNFQVKIEDAGSYQCAVEGQETWKSEAVMLDVQYGPKRVVLSVSPPGDVVKGSSITLTCSSSGSNPPIQSLILLKDNTEVTQEKIMTISNIQPSDSGRYSCQAKNFIATVTSPEVTLHVQYPPRMTSMNPQGEKNSTEVLLHMDTMESHLVILRVGIGVKVLAVLLLPLVMWWAWKQDSGMAKEEDNPDYVNISGSVGRRRGFISSADQDTRVVEEESNV